MRRAGSTDDGLKKKEPDGTENCSRPKSMRLRIHTVLRLLCRSCGFRVRFESHFHPSWLLLDQIPFLRYLLPSASVPPIRIRIVPVHTTSALSPVRLCSVTKETDGWSHHRTGFFSILRRVRPHGVTSSPAIPRQRRDRHAISGARKFSKNWTNRTDGENKLCPSQSP